MRKNYTPRFYLLCILILLPHALLAQEVITGKTINQITQEPIPFVNIIEKGSANGSTSDIDGNFQIEVVQLPTTLVFSYVGFETQEVEVNSTSPLEVLFTESAAALDEVVVTGLATSIKRSNAANAVASISSEELVGVTTPATLDGALYGKFPGAMVSANSGAPGGGISIKLRGATSIQGNTQPLYIIDGVYVDNSSIEAGLNAVSSAGAAQDNPSNRIADINPQDIANIEILKGASAAAIYGSRAAAGVVIITTKRGIAGETNYHFSQSLGWTEVTKLQGLRDFTEDRVRESFGENAVSDFVEARNSGTLTDYEKELFGEKGLISVTNFNVSGGGDKTRFYAGATYNEEEGIVKNTGYEKLSLKLNLDHKASDFIDLALSTSYTNSSSDRGFFNNDNTGTTLGVALINTVPWLDLFPDQNGNYPDNPMGSSNLLQTRDLMTNNEKVDRVILGGSANIDLYKSEKSNLELILRGGLDYYGFNTSVFFPKELQFQKPENEGQNGVSVQGNTSNKNYNLSAFMVHTYYTDNGLNFRTQAGMTREYFDRNGFLITAADLVASETNVDQATYTGVDQTRLKQEDAGFFIQEEVNWQDKLIATVGLRGDKSSNNGDANKLFYYPKASLAVNFNQFEFWNPDAKVSQFKVRVAYGEAGNFPPIGAVFTSYDSYSSVGIDGLLKGIVLRTVQGNSSLKSERQKEFETGVDFGLFSNRLSGSISYYIKTVDDLILEANSKPSTGFSREFVNAGSLRNEGVEIGLNAAIFHRENFTWDLGVNFFKNKSEITRLDVPAYNTGGFGASLGQFRIEEGQSVTQIVGLGPDPGPSGYQHFGDLEPDFQMSFHNQFTYRNFDLSFLWQWKQGGDNINLTHFLSDLSGTSYDYDDITMDPDGVVPNGVYRASQIGVNAGAYIEDASYLKLREVGFSYRFPQSVTDNILNGTFELIKVGFSGTNLLSFFDYNGYDPEVSNFVGNGVFSGIDVAPFPSSRRYLFNLTFNF